MRSLLFHSEVAGSAQTNVVAVLLRLALAAAFLYHGLDKVVNHSAGADWVAEMYWRVPDRVIEKMEGVNKPRSYEAPSSLTFMGTQLAVAWGEVLGGLLLGAGLLTRLVAVVMIVIQVGAIVLVTGPRSLHLHGGGREYEYNAALMVICLALLILGAGKWSSDWLLMQQHKRAKKAVALSVPVPAPDAEFPAHQVVPGATS
jgi:uncharacterized membrane protein YphA (DoxX/SURF4 family)